MRESTSGDKGGNSAANDPTARQERGRSELVARVIKLLDRDWPTPVRKRNTTLCPLGPERQEVAKGVTKGRLDLAEELVPFRRCRLGAQTSRRLGGVPPEGKF